MDCERVREWSGAALLGDASWEPTSEVQEHFATCSTCREEVTAARSAWGELKVLPSAARAGASAGAAVPMAVSREFEARNRERSPVARPSRVARAAVVLLALGVGAMGGWVLARSGVDGTSVADAAAPPVRAGEQYLLLIRETPATLAVEQRVGSAALVEEYAAWAMSLAEAGRLVAAEKLADAGAAVSEAGSETVANTVADAVSGFFLVRADDEAAALAIARESPHVRHGGVVEVRRIEQTRRGT